MRSRVLFVCHGTVSRSVVSVSRLIVPFGRLDASGVDGESVWMAQSSQPQDDAVCFVQPSAEVLQTVTQISESAGSRPVLLVNPQWKERDDPLDALSRKGGFLGSVGRCVLWWEYGKLA